MGDSSELPDLCFMFSPASCKLIYLSSCPVHLLNRPNLQWFLDRLTEIAGIPVKELTKQQDEIYRMLQSYIARHGFPPTRADICKHFGYKSPTTAADHLGALERRGYIELIPVTPRGIRLVEPSHDSGLPIVGRVALGQPILSEASIERRIDVDPELFAPHADYLFRVVV